MYKDSATEMGSAGVGEENRNITPLYPSRIPDLTLSGTQKKLRNNNSGGVRDHSRMS